MGLVELSALYDQGIIQIGDLKLETGKLLKDVHIAYERIGPIGAPTILVCHALTGNQSTVGTVEDPGWWSEFIGPNKYINTDEYQVITTNVIGGCHGSTGPLSINPDTGTLYRATFPFVTVRDMVEAQYAALRKLGVNHLRAVIGGSLGGMQVLEWGILHPAFMDLLIPIAATPFLSDYAIAFNAMARIAITSDPAWDNGNYPINNPPVHGLSIARMAGMITYRSDSLFNQRFQRQEYGNWGESHTELTYQVESYLTYQGEKLTQRFDTNSYLYLLKAMDRYDIGRNRGGWQKALEQAKAKIIGIGFKGDLLYPASELEQLVKTYCNQAKKGYFYEVDTNFGHDGFLVEFEKWAGIVKEHLSKSK